MRVMACLSPSPCPLPDGDPREVVRDPEARYFGGRVEEHSLVPLGEARLGRIGLDEWLRRSRAAA